GHAPDANRRAPLYVTVFDAEGLAGSLALATELRAGGLQVTSHLQADKLQKQFKQADRIGAKLVLVLGPEEVAQGKVNVKDLRNGQQHSLERTGLAQALGKLLDS